MTDDIEKNDQHEPPPESQPDSPAIPMSSSPDGTTAPDESPGAGQVEEVTPLSTMEEAGFRQLLADTEFREFLASLAGAGRAASDTLLTWSQRRDESKQARALIDRGRQQAETEFELKRRELEQKADIAKADQERQASIARADQEHREMMFNLDLKRAEFEARIKYTDNRTRGIVLYLVVAALVLMPVYAMSTAGVSPQEFAQYIAPITGIAGTVLGYWFGRQR